MLLDKKSDLPRLSVAFPACVHEWRGKTATSRPSRHFCSVLPVKSKSNPYLKPNREKEGNFPNQPMSLSTPLGTSFPLSLGIYVGQAEALYIGMGAYHLDSRYYLLATSSKACTSYESVRSS